MQYRTDPKTGNRLSILGFGCMRFPGSLGRTDVEKTEALLLDAYNKGVNYFDTAYLYPGSEEVVGSFFAKHGLREKVYIATKLPQMLCKESGDFEKFFQIQAGRLQTGYIDYYLVHNISNYEQWERLVALGIEDWIAAKKKSGEIRSIGFSFHGPQAHFGKLLDAFDWDFCQIQYNYVNINYQAGQKGLLAAAAKGLPVIIMEPLLGGKLANGLPKEAEALFDQADARYSPAAWALRWIWNQPECTLLLSGMNEAAQLEENTRLASEATPGMLGGAELAAVDSVVEAFNKSYKVPCTGCNYCMPCPAGINIPACFSSYNISFATGWAHGVRQYVTACAALEDHPHFASDCVQCGKCVSHCPQGIQIPGELRRVKGRLQPFFMPVVLPLARRLMR